VLPAFSTPAAAQPTETPPQEQPTDVPQEQPTDVPQELPTDVPQEQPTEITTQDQPTAVPDAVAEETGSLEVRVRACPEGQDLSAPDPTALAGACTGAFDTGFRLVSSLDGSFLGSSTGDGGPGIAFFGGVIPGSYSLNLFSQYAGPMAVFCEGNTLLGNTKPYAQASLAGVGTPLDVLPGEAIVCDWYVVQPADTAGNSVTVYKWQCEPGTEYGRELVYYQGGLPDQATGPCETEHLNIPIALTDANGPRATTTQANGTQWDNVVLDQQGQFTIKETIPTGYGDPAVFCGTLDEDTQTKVQSTGGTIVLKPTSSPFDYQCNWYNIPAQDSTVTIRKWECPQGTTIDTTPQAHQSACTQPMNNVTFTLTDSKGPRSLATTAGQVQWTDVAIGAVSISETIPPGYSPQPYVVCGWTAMYNGAIVDAFPQPVATINGVLNTTIPYPGTTYFCDWYNQYAGPGETTIYKWTCPEGYDPYAWNANPKNDCTEATNGVTFVLDQPEGVDLQTDTGDSTNGAVYFGGLTPGMYTVNEIVPSGIAGVFVLDCVGLNTGSVHPMPLSAGPTLPMNVAGGDKIVCDWYNVPAYDPQYGWMTVSKYACTTPTYVSDIDCEIYEQGQGFELQMWNGASWISAGAGTTNAAGQLTWINLAPGTYKVVEQGAAPCHMSASKADGQGNPVVDANAGATVKVYNCGKTPPPGGKMPTKYPNTGVEPTGSSPDGRTMFAVAGLLGFATVSRRTFLRRSLGTAAVVGGGSLVVTSVLAGQPIQPIEPIGPDGTPEGSPTGSPEAGCLFPATPEAAPDGTPVSCARGEVPVHIRVEAIDVDANIEILEIIGGAMQQPTGATDVAWYKETARLGERGNVLLAGHLNFWGVPEGVFFKLDILKPGDVVELEGEAGEPYRYVVEWVDQFPSDEEPPEEALGQTGEEAITLITCGGEWVTERAEYDHRTLARAYREGTVLPEATPGTPSS
jgi:sortase (surface protein transpeptidase)